MREGVVWSPSSNPRPTPKTGHIQTPSQDLGEDDLRTSATGTLGSRCPQKQQDLGEEEGPEERLSADRMVFTPSLHSKVVEEGGTQGVNQKAHGEGLVRSPGTKHPECLHPPQASQLGAACAPAIAAAQENTAIKQTFALILT